MSTPCIPCIPCIPDPLTCTNAGYIRTGAYPRLTAGEGKH
jgi:hypothetical protein